MKYTFVLTEEEAQKVLNSLLKEPYIDVVDVINNIQKQAVEQKQKATNNG